MAVEIMPLEATFVPVKFSASPLQRGAPLENTTGDPIHTGFGVTE